MIRACIILNRTRQRKVPRENIRWSGGWRRLPLRLAAGASLVGLIISDPVEAGAQPAAGATDRPAVASAAAEQAARIEYQKLLDAASTGSRIPRLRYLSIPQKYPHTRAAYEANLELAKLDFAALEKQKQATRTKGPIAEASKRFLDDFAYAAHAHPPMPDLKQRYRTELEPLYFSAVKNIGTWQAALDYLAAYPDNVKAAEIEGAIERAILNPNAGWEAREIVEMYAPIRPERAREQRLAAQVETNLFQGLHTGLPRETLEKFLQEYPGSIYFNNVEGMIRQQLAREVSLYTDRATLEDHVARRPGSVEGVQSKAMLEELGAQEAVYRAAAAAGTVGALEQFIEENPQSRYLREAAKRIEAIKLATLSAGEQASLKSYQGQVDVEMRTEEAQLKSYADRLDALTKSVEAQRAEIRSLQMNRADAVAGAREQRRLAEQAGKSVQQIQKLVKQNPGLQDDLKQKRADQAKFLGEAKRLDGQAAALGKQVEAKRTKAAEAESELAALRTEAQAAQVAALGKRNGLHHEYLARLDEAWKARGGS